MIILLYLREHVRRRQTDDEDGTGFFVHCVDENVTVDIEHFPNFEDFV